LRQRFFGQRPADAAIAIFKRMDADKVEMRDAGARQGRQGRWSCRVQFQRMIDREPFYRSCIAGFMIDRKRFYRSWAGLGNVSWNRG
jgi:hypothetical protein